MEDGSRWGSVGGTTGSTEITFDSLDLTDTESTVLMVSSSGFSAPRLVDGHSVQGQAAATVWFALGGYSTATVQADVGRRFKFVTDGPVFGLPQG